MGQLKRHPAASTESTANRSQFRSTSGLNHHHPGCTPSSPEMCAIFARDGAHLCPIPSRSPDESLKRQGHPPSGGNKKTPCARRKAFFQIDMLNYYLFTGSTSHHTGTPISALLFENFCLSAAALQLSAFAVCSVTGQRKRTGISAVALLGYAVFPSA